MLHTVWIKVLTFVDMLRRGRRGVEKGEEEEREERPCSPLGHHFSKINICRLQEPRSYPVVNPRPPPVIHSQDEKFKIAPRKCKETSGTSYFEKWPGETCSWLTARSTDRERLQVRMFSQLGRGWGRRKKWNQSIATEARDGENRYEYGLLNGFYIQVSLECDKSKNTNS